VNLKRYFNGLIKRVGIWIPSSRKVMILITTYGNVYVKSSSMFTHSFHISTQTTHNAHILQS